MNFVTKNTSGCTIYKSDFSNLINQDRFLCFRGGHMSLPSFLIHRPQPHLYAVHFLLVDIIYYVYRLLWLVYAGFMLTAAFTRDLVFTSRNLSVRNLILVVSNFISITSSKPCKKKYLPYII